MRRNVQSCTCGRLRVGGRYPRSLTRDGALCGGCIPHSNRPDRRDSAHISRPRARMGAGRGSCQGPRPRGLHQPTAGSAAIYPVWHTRLRQPDRCQPARASNRPRWCATCRTWPARSRRRVAIRSRRSCASPGWGRPRAQRPRRPLTTSRSRSSWTCGRPAATPSRCGKSRRRWRSWWRARRWPRGRARGRIVWSASRVTGTSMAPTVREGDLVALDRERVDPGRWGDVRCSRRRRLGAQAGAPHRRPLASNERQPCLHAAADGRRRPDRGSGGVDGAAIKRGPAGTG